MLRLSRQLCAAVLAVALVTGQAGVCAGWMPSPEARMACCADGGSCPMHEPDPSGDGSTRVLTQAAADRCCAASEHHGSAPPATDVAALPALGIAPVALPAFRPAPDAHAQTGRASVPVTTFHVPRHVLLSVFLV